MIWGSFNFPLFTQWHIAWLSIFMQISWPASCWKNVYNSLQVMDIYAIHAFGPVKSTMAQSNLYNTNTATLESFVKMISVEFIFHGFLIMDNLLWLDEWDGVWTCDQGSLLYYRIVRSQKLIVAPVLQTETYPVVYFKSPYLISVICSSDILISQLIVSIMYPTCSTTWSCNIILVTWTSVIRASLYAGLSHDILCLHWFTIW